MNWNIKHKSLDFKHYELMMVPRTRYHIPLYLGDEKEYDLKNPRFIQEKKVFTPMVMNQQTINNFLRKDLITQVKRSKSKKKEEDEKPAFIVKKTLLRDPGSKLEDEFVLEKKKVVNRKNAINLFKSMVKTQFQK